MKKEWREHEERPEVDIHPDFQRVTLKNIPYWKIQGYDAFRFLNFSHPCMTDGLWKGSNTKNFEIQTDHQISARRPDLMIIDQKI